MLVRPSVRLVLLCSTCRTPHGQEEDSNVLFDFADEAEINSCFPVGALYPPGGWRRVDADTIVCGRCPPGRT